MIDADDGSDDVGTCADDVTIMHCGRERWAHLLDGCGCESWENCACGASVDMHWIYEGCPPSEIIEKLNIEWCCGVFTFEQNVVCACPSHTCGEWYCRCGTWLGVGFGKTGHICTFTPTWRGGWWGNYAEQPKYPVKSGARWTRRYRARRGKKIR